jgi:hypothetical protein
MESKLLFELPGKVRFAKELASTEDPVPEGPGYWWMMR